MRLAQLGKVLAVAFSTFVPLTALAIEEGPLLRKTTFIGFVGPAEQTAANCQIFTDRVETIKQAAGLSAKMVTPVQLDVDGVRKFIAEAAKGKVSKKEAPNDEPLIRYQALIAEGSAEPKVISLKSFGSEIIDNSSDASLTLVNFIDQLCD